jgi:hypothetical protein
VFFGRSCHISLHIHMYIYIYIYIYITLNISCHKQEANFIFFDSFKEHVLLITIIKSPNNCTHSAELRCRQCHRNNFQLFLVRENKNYCCLWTSRAGVASRWTAKYCSSTLGRSKRSSSFPRHPYSPGTQPATCSVATVGSFCQC